jgi:hypothetical protein
VWSVGIVISRDRRGYGADHPSRNAGMCFNLREYTVINNAQEAFHRDWCITMASKIEDMKLAGAFLSFLVASPVF